MKIGSRVEGEQVVPAPGRAEPSSFMPFLRGSWLNAQSALYIWTGIVAACVVWQPLLLGFYSDDWFLWIEGSTRGRPFSLTRLLFMNFTNPVRIGCLPARFLGSSLFGAHPLLWQGALLLVNCVIAISIAAAIRVLIQPRTPLSRAAAAAAGLCWLLVPWNAGARYWPSLLPNVAMIAVQGFLCVLLVRGWEKNQSRAITAGILYLWMCLSYEAFYFQCIPIVLIGVALWWADRVPLRPVLVSAASLFVCQGLAGLWYLYSNQYWTAMSPLPAWRQIARRNLLNVPAAILEGISEISPEFVLCGVVLLIMGLAVYIQCLSRGTDNRSAYMSLLLTAIAIGAGLVSIVIFSLVGRDVTGTGVRSRSLMVFNFWGVMAAGILTAFVLERLHGVSKAVFTFALVGFGLCLAVGQVLRASDWVTAWNMQQKILAEAPVADLRRTEQDARIILVNPRDINGAPVFVATWDINRAIAWTYPFLRTRQFIVYNPWQGLMKWDGSRLSYEGGPEVDTATAVYVWHPSDMSFWRPDGPFIINQNNAVERTK